jgi:Tetracyclin repressor-like, C-terminal domain
VTVLKCPLELGSIYQFDLNRLLWLVQRELGFAKWWRSHSLSRIVRGAVTFRTLVSFVEVCQQEGVLPAGDTKELALLAWSMVHGIAKLAITGRYPFSSKNEILKFAEYVIENSLPTAIRGQQGYIHPTTAI